MVRSWTVFLSMLFMMMFAMNDVCDSSDGVVDHDDDYG